MLATTNEKLKAIKEKVVICFWYCKVAFLSRKFSIILKLKADISFSYCKISHVKFYVLNSYKCAAILIYGVLQGLFQLVEKLKSKNIFSFRYNYWNHIPLYSSLWVFKEL